MLPALQLPPSGIVTRAAQSSPRPRYPKFVDAGSRKRLSLGRWPKLLSLSPCSHVWPADHQVLSRSFPFHVAGPSPFFGWKMFTPDPLEDVVAAAAFRACRRVVVFHPV